MRRAPLLQRPGRGPPAARWTPPPPRRRAGGGRGDYAGSRDHSSAGGLVGPRRGRPHNTLHVRAVRIGIRGELDPYGVGEPPRHGKSEFAAAARRPDVVEKVSRPLGGERRAAVNASDHGAVAPPRRRENKGIVRPRGGSQGGGPEIRD